MIAKARELPLTVEAPIQELEELDLAGIMQERYRGDVGEIKGRHRGDRVLVW